MPDPIQPTPWTAAARRVVDLNSEQLKGPSAGELAARQRAQTLAEGARGLIAAGVKHLLSELGASAGTATSAMAVALAGPGATLFKLVSGYASEMAAADQLNEAHRRDAVHLAVTWLAAPALPHDFVENRQELYRNAGSDPSASGAPANRLISRIAFDGRYDEAKHLAQQQASTGRTMAARLSIDSAEALEQRLGSNAEFAALYQNPDNVAFRLGVDSVVWQAEHPARPR